jgi:DNA-binding YbaB/EbfC family protein
MEQIRKVQEDVQAAQEEISAMTVIGYAAGESVQVEVGGDQVVRRVKLSPAVVDPDSIELLEDLLMIAINDALGKIQDITAERMAAVTGGLDLPGLE